MDEERRRILDLLAADKITVEQAEALLVALAGAGAAAGAPRPPEPPGPPPRSARSLQIIVLKEDSDKSVNVTVPIGLIKFASRFLPKEARVEMADSGIQLDEIVSSLENPELLAAGSTLLELNTGDEDGASTITIKAV